MTWFYTEKKLVKKPLCFKCAEDNDSVDYYGAKDMYTADEVVRRLRHILNEELKQNTSFSPEMSSEILSKAVEILKPTLEEESLKLEREASE